MNRLCRNAGISGRCPLGIEKEYSDLKKFIRRFKSFEPSLQVRRFKDDYVLCIGGYERIQTGGPMRMNPANEVCRVYPLSHWPGMWCVRLTDMSLWTS
jgi:hypothetical protein